MRGVQINTPNAAVWLDEDEVRKLAAAIAKIRTIHADWQKDPANRNYASARFETPSGVGIEAVRNVVDARGRKIDFNLIAGDERYQLTAADVAQIESLLAAP